jgi:hypothetical protein
MECLNEALTKETVLERIDSYLHGELSLDEDKQFTDHILECEYCQQTLLLCKMMLRVGKEYADEIFPTVEETQQDERIPTLWLMLNNAVMKEIKFRTGIPWTTELSKPGLYSVINQEKQILYELRKLPGVEKGVSVRGATDSISRPKIEVIEIPLQGKEVKGELAIKLEKKEKQLVLSLSIKVLKR